jgi:hypothetical protein
VEATFLHATGKTDRHNEIVAFRNFSKVPNNESYISGIQLTVRGPRCRKGYQQRNLMPQEGPSLVQGHRVNNFYNGGKKNGLDPVY